MWKMSRKVRKLSFRLKTDQGRTLRVTAKKRTFGPDSLDLGFKYCHIKSGLSSGTGEKFQH
jgi:hypothetical protein